MSNTPTPRGHRKARSAADRARALWPFLTSLANLVQIAQVAYQAWTFVSSADPLVSSLLAALVRSCLGIAGLALLATLLYLVAQRLASTAADAYLVGVFILSLTILAHQLGLV